MFDGECTVWSHTNGSYSVNDGVYICPRHVTFVNILNLSVDLLLHVCHQLFVFFKINSLHFYWEGGPSFLLNHLLNSRIYIYLRSHNEKQVQYSSLN